MHTRFRLVFATFIATALHITCVSAEIKFKHHFVDRDGPPGESWGTNNIADLDNDGRLDVIVSKAPWGEGEKAAYWYRNLGGIDKWSPRIPLRTEFHTGCGAVVFDVDRDGWRDFVAGTWLRNPGETVVDSQFSPGGWAIQDRIHDLELGDFNDDGYPEMVANVQHDKLPGLYLYRAGKDPAKPWEETLITRVGFMKGSRPNKPQGEVHAAVSPRGIGDLDGDGDLDIAYLGMWCENVDGEGHEWKTQRNLGFAPDGKWGSAVRCWIADINRDGHNDIVQSICDAPQAKVIWLDNTKGDGSQWKLNELPNDVEPGDFHSLVVADFDLDGDLDIYVDEMEHLHVPSGREGKIGMIVWENTDGRGGKWNKQVILTGLGGHQAQAADLDGDGDIDIVTRPYTAHTNANGGRMHVSVLENLSRNP